MWRSSQFVLAPWFAILAGVGCDSTLTEYRCEEAADCSGQGQAEARCEPSGHCSFADTSCTESGFRFGQNSGGESGSCAPGPVVPDPDAGVVEETPPIAQISLVVPGNCGTSVTVDGTRSEAFEGARIDEFRWTLKDADEEQIIGFAGEPDAALVAGIYSLGGTYSQPHVNFAPYHGYAAYEIDVVTSATEGFFQDNLDLSAYSDLHLYFGARMGPSFDTSNDIHVQLLAGNQVLYSGSLPVSESFSDFDFEIGLTAKQMAAAANVTLLLSFENSGTVWLDNIGLFGVSDGLEILQNGSAEDGNQAPWIYAAAGSGLGTAQVREIPVSLREREDYTLQLQVVDSRGLESDPVAIDVVGTTCLPPF